MPGQKRSKFGHIERKGPDRYLVRWSETGPDGARRQPSMTVSGTYDDAVLALARRIANGPAPESVTWGSFWRACVEPTLGELAEKTAHEYRRLWRVELEPRIGDETMADATHRSAEAVLRSVASPTVQRAAMRLWRKVANMAVREGMLDRSPIEGIRLDPYRKPRKTLYTADEIAPWMEAVRGIKYEAVLLMELGGGMSHEEACAMLAADVEPWDFKGSRYAVCSITKALATVNGRKVLKETKNGYREREAVIGSPFAPRILELAEASDGPMLPSGLPHDAERPEAWYANPATVTHNYRDWCRRHGVKYVCPGNLRTAFSMLHAEAGSPDSLVSLAMGHSDGTTRGRNYMQATRRGGAMIADLLAEYLSEASETAKC